MLLTGSRCCLVARDGEGFHARGKRRGRDAEELGRAFFARDTPGAALQGPDQVGSFEGLHFGDGENGVRALVQRGGSQGVGDLAGRWQEAFVDQEFLAAAEDGGAFEEVFEFADVAGPGVAAEAAAEFA
jgi:hypothetical protein